MRHLLSENAEWMCAVKSLLGEKERGLLKLRRMCFVPPAGLAVFVRPRWCRAFPDHPRPPPDSRSEERGRLCGRAWAAIPSPFAIQSTGVAMECRVVTFHAASKGHMCNHRMPRLTTLTRLLNSGARWVFFVWLVVAFVIWLPGRSHFCCNQRCQLGN